MTPNQRMQALYSGKPVDRTPFAPAIYEHKAALVDSVPSKVARDPDLFTQALLEEYDRYRADLLVVGIDVYNIEAEALGCKVTYYPDDDPSIPGIRMEDAAMEDGAEPETLKKPNPRKDARMAVNVQVAKRVQQKIGQEVPVRGALSGPYSLSCELIGSENFIISTLTNPAYAQRLLDFSSGVILEFGKAYLEVGVEPIIFDSRAMPQMTSPDIFRSIYQPATKKLIDAFFQAGANVCPLVIGGDCTAVADAYADSGSKNIISDFVSDWGVFLGACKRKDIALRRNVNPATLQKGTKREVERAMSDIMKMGQGFSKFIAGTGIVPFDTPSENVLAARDIVWKWAHQEISTV